MGDIVRSQRTVDAVHFLGVTASGKGRRRNSEAAAEGAVVSNILREGVVHVEVQAVAHLLLQSDLQRVVAEIADIPPRIAEAALLRKGFQHLLDGGRSAHARRLLEVRRSRGAGEVGLQDGHIGGRRGLRGIERKRPNATPGQYKSQMIFVNRDFVSGQKNRSDLRQELGWTACEEVARCSEFGIVWRAWRPALL